MAGDRFALLACRDAAGHRPRGARAQVAQRPELRRPDRPCEDREGAQRHLRGFHGLGALGAELVRELESHPYPRPMQVNVAFAEQFASAHPYPYPVKVSIADEVFTRRGSLYFGIAHLLAYPAAYDRYLYRFADFNAGQYASRNAAFQIALSDASGVQLVPDGALVSHEGDASGPGNTELAVRSLGPRLKIGDAAIRAALEQGRSNEFERTA